MIHELLKHKELLHKEYEYERAEFHRETQLLGVNRKVRRGDCWYPLRIGRGYYNTLDRFVVEVFRTDRLDTPHNFEYGKPVCFFYQDASGHITHLAAIGTVNLVDENRMIISLPDQSALLTLEDKEQPGVQLYFDEQTYRLMFSALDAVLTAKGNHLALLRDTFHDSAPLHKLHNSPVRLPWLNPTQEHAVNEVLCAKEVAVVHGPPGTGKTTTLAEAVYEVLRRENQVLVCAQSNMAVDWISEQLVDRGISVLRIGNPSRVNDKMLSFTYERSFESHPDYPELWAIRRTIRQLYSIKKEKRQDAFHQKLAGLKDKAAEIERHIREALFSNVRVVASTLTGAGHPLLEGQHFHTLFIDEAAQALEAACWIPLQKVDRVIFAGDHCQLPPTIKCIEAERQGLGKTLMETIVENKPQAVTLLETQYRMTEALMHFSSEWFYGGRIQSAPGVRAGSILDIERPITWIDTHSEEQQEHFVSDTCGRANDAEARRTVQALLDFLAEVTPQRILSEGIDIGIISPYKAQVQQLRHLVTHTAELKPFRRLITVNTVDGFQGQERDVILISLVRSNENGKIGFLNDLRRMNVAITRARMKLIILGDVATLSHHKFYKKLHEYAQSGC